MWLNIASKLVPGIIKTGMSIASNRRRTKELESVAELKLAEKMAKRCIICKKFPAIAGKQRCALCEKGFEAMRITKAKAQIEGIEEHRKSRYIPTRVIREVWRRDQNKCVECGSRENLELHHIIPFSKGGSNTARNIILLCSKCHKPLGDKI